MGCHNFVVWDNENQVSKVYRPNIIIYQLDLCNYTQVYIN